MFQVIFNPLRSGGNKSSYILKQTCSKKLQVGLSMYDLLPPGGKWLWHNMLQVSR